MVEDEIDLESRQLCIDGNCTGVLGPDGRCKICGLNAEGIPSGSGDSEHSMTSDWKGMPEADDFEARQLCPDGSCTGLLGLDGQCKVCGKSS
jgi:hypothetical protein